MLETKKSNILMPVFRCVCYTVFMLCMLLTDNMFKISDSKIIAAFMVFSISFEFLISPLKRGCKKFANFVLTSGIVISGLMLISIYESRKNDYNKERTHLNFIELNER